MRNYVVYIVARSTFRPLAENEMMLSHKWDLLMQKCSCSVSDVIMQKVIQWKDEYWCTCLQAPHISSKKMNNILRIMINEKIHWNWSINCDSKRNR